MSNLMNDPEGYKPENRIHIDPNHCTVEEVLEFMKTKEVYKAARESVNRMEPVELQDTSERVRLLCDKLDCIANTLVDANSYISGNRPKPPEYATPECILHALIILDIQADFIFQTAENIRINVR